MKKLLLLLATIVFLTTSCRGPMGPPGQGTNWAVFDVPIRSSDWQRVGGVDALNSFFQFQVRDSRINNFIYNDGLVTAYLEFNGRFQTPLPYVQHYGEVDNLGNEHLWTETIDYEYTPGQITFFLTPSDFLTGYTPGSYVVRVVLLW